VDLLKTPGKKDQAAFKREQRVLDGDLWGYSGGKKANAFRGQTRLEGTIREIKEWSSDTVMEK